MDIDFFIKTKDEGIQGLATIVRNDIAVTELGFNFGPGTENQAFSITYRGNSFHLVNIYISVNSLNTQLFPDELSSSPTLLVGDLNARAPLLGSVGTTLNENGKAWFNFLNDNNHVALLGEDEPTHKRGGRIDYACTFCDCWSAVCKVSN